MAGWGERFGDYVERLGDVLGHADRRAPLRAYTTGLLLPGERKSVEPMAARLDPGRVGAAHQSLHHFVADGGAHRLQLDVVTRQPEVAHPAVAVDPLHGPEQPLDPGPDRRHRLVERKRGRAATGCRA